MAEALWAEKPRPKFAKDFSTHAFVYCKEEMTVWLENLKAKITQLNECLGEYESHEWCGHCIIDAKCAQITMHVIEHKKKAAIIDFLFDEEDVRTGNLLGELQIWREKAEKWNELCEGLEYGVNTPVRDILLEINAVNRDNELRRKKLEAVETYIVKLRNQAKKTGDIFERGFCTGIADNLEKILEGEE